MRQECSRVGVSASERDDGMPDRPEQGPAHSWHARTQDQINIQHARAPPCSHHNRHHPRAITHKHAARTHTRIDTYLHMQNAHTHLQRRRECPFHRPPCSRPPPKISMLHILPHRSLHHCPLPRAPPKAAHEGEPLLRVLAPSTPAGPATELCRLDGGRS